MLFGYWGEEVAVKYLKNRGYEILGRNFRCRAGEIDIIARDGSVQVFIEVKSRKRVDYGLPCEAINYTKKQHILKTAAYYNMLHRSFNQEIRIDSIEILVKGGQAYIRHLKNIL